MNVLEIEYFVPPKRLPKREIIFKINEKSEIIFEDSAHPERESTLKRKPTLAKHYVEEFNTHEWFEWENNLEIDVANWYANTPRGRREVRASFNQGLPAIYWTNYDHELNPKEEYTVVPHLPRQLVTRDYPGYKLYPEHPADVRVETVITKFPIKYSIHIKP